MFSDLPKKKEFSSIQTKADLTRDQLKKKAIDHVDKTYPNAQRKRADTGGSAEEVKIFKISKSTRKYSSNFHFRCICLRGSGNHSDFLSNHETW